MELPVVAPVDYFALGLSLGLGFVIIVFLFTLWRFRRRERRLAEAARRELLGER
jgi:protein-S-isoprenylcysteine O-methyltransferase Ste14